MSVYGDSVNPHFYREHIRDSEKDLFKRVPPSMPATCRPATTDFDREYFDTSRNDSTYYQRRDNVRRYPPLDYCCIICLKNDHYFQKCPEIVKQRSTGLTPYQGTKMCSGKFKCPKCKRKWISSSSWANHGQDCVKCNITVMPHKQWPNDNTNETPKVSLFHPERLCERCKLLGHNCSKLKTNENINDTNL